MENFWENSLDADGAEHGVVAIGDAVDTWRADDPLGDEAAFPMTWQHLAGDSPRD